MQWGVYHEVCEQINCIGLIPMRNKFASMCHEKGWSKQSAQHFLDSTGETFDLCIAMVEIASVVDVGHPLVSETDICESKHCGAFTVWEGIMHLQSIFSWGVESFDLSGKFVELEKCAKEAAEIMETKYMVSTKNMWLLLCSIVITLDDELIVPW